MDYEKRVATHMADLRTRYTASTLTYEQVAQELGRNVKNPYQWVRSAIERGEILPGLQKVCGGYTITVLAFAEWLAGIAPSFDQGESTPAAPVAPSPPAPTPRRTRPRKSAREEFLPEVRDEVTGEVLDPMEHVRRITADLKRKFPTLTVQGGTNMAEPLEVVPRMPLALVPSPNEFPWWARDFYREFWGQVLRALVSSPVGA